MNCKESRKISQSTPTDVCLTGGFGSGLRKPGVISALLRGGCTRNDASEMLPLYLAHSQSNPREIKTLEELFEFPKSWSCSCSQQEPNLHMCFSVCVCVLMCGHVHCLREKRQARQYLHNLYLHILLHKNGSVSYLEIIIGCEPSWAKIKVKARCFPLTVTFL